MSDKAPSKEPFRFPDFGLYLALGAVGVEIVIPIIVGAYLDPYLGGAGWGVAVGVVFGFALSLVHMVYLLRRLEKKPPEQSRGPR
jgi:predicted Kef-type K+ transport protein